MDVLSAVGSKASLTTCPRLHLYRVFRVREEPAFTHTGVDFAGPRAC